MKQHNNIASFHDVEVYKVRIKGEIGRKELEIGHRYRDFKEALVPANINSFLVDTILSRPDILLKAGLTLYSLFSSTKAKKPRKKK